jgi:hypothetical protein
MVGHFKRLLLMVFIFASPQLFAASSDYFLVGSGGQRRGNVALVAHTFSYNDISVSDEDVQFVHKTSMGLNLGFRVHQIFMFSLLYRQNSPDQRKTTGFAGRAYAPGFFLLGDDISGFITGFTKRRVHTYFEGEAGLTTILDEDGTESKFVDSVGRLGLEITLVRGFYFDLSYGVCSAKGNNTTVGGVGLGVRF